MDKLPILLLSSFLIRLLITGAQFGDALVIIALSALYAGYYYLKVTKEPEANQELKTRIIELEDSHKTIKDKINSISFGSHLKR